MVAAVFTGNGRFELTERPVPQVTSGTDVLVAVSACGICGSDLEILATPPGHEATQGVVLGHEFVGVVQQVGSDVTGLRPGDRVAAAADIPCNQCTWCQRGDKTYCENMAMLGVHADGGLAPFAVAPANAFVRIASNVADHVAALAEPLSTVLRGVHRTGVFPGQTAVVIGAGPIGLMFTALLRHAGVSVIVVEPSAPRAELAKSMGAHAAVGPDSAELTDTLRQATSGDGADIVVDAVGSQLGPAMHLVRKGGRIVLFGVNSRARTSVAQHEITLNEVEIVGSVSGQDMLPDAVRILERGEVDLSPLVTHRISLDGLAGAIAELRAGTAAKVVIEFGPQHAAAEAV